MLEARKIQTMKKIFTTGVLVGLLSMGCAANTDESLENASDAFVESSAELQSAMQDLVDAHYCDAVAAEAMFPAARRWICNRAQAIHARFQNSRAKFYRVNQSEIKGVAMQAGSSRQEIVRSSNGSLPPSVKELKPVESGAIEFGITIPTIAKGEDGRGEIHVKYSLFTESACAKAVIPSVSSACREWLEDMFRAEAE